MGWIKPVSLPKKMGDGTTLTDRQFNLKEIVKKRLAEMILAHAVAVKNIKNVVVSLLNDLFPNVLLTILQTIPSSRRY